MGGTIKAQQELQENLQRVGADTRKRKNWAYLRASVLADWAETQNWDTEEIPSAEVQMRRFFGTRLDAPVIEGNDGGDDGKLYAVWREIREPREGELPNFLTNPPGPLIDLRMDGLEDVDVEAEEDE